MARVFRRAGSFLEKGATQMGPREVHVVIRGRVQGVAFRHSLKRQATWNNIRGWVRNLPDGSVEALFQGQEAEIEKILKWCKKGPPSAGVEEVEVVWREPSSSLTSFEIVF
jgi:acylphosphatase